jgi:hypothetical protein
MPAKILAFDPSRKVSPRHYTPIALRGRLLQMAPRAGEGASGRGPREGFFSCSTTLSQGRRRG